MCGICGILRSDQVSVDQVLLQRMNQKIHHRGPDGEGYYFNPGVGLGMRRLAVIDLMTGDQPIPNEDETVWIVFNGEIFNFQELRRCLERNGHRFRTKTDTECIVHLYEEYGENCVDHLRGQFAFAIWDQIEGKAFIARDRFGQKPLYYAISDGSLYFSSELPSLLMALPEQKIIDFEAIDLYLSLQYIPEPRTPFKNIYKLPAAHRMLFHHGKIDISRYWELTYEPKHQASQADLLLELREKVADAVQIRMISDVPLGAHLSGGIDSSIIVSLMAGMSNYPVRTFTVGFDADAFSEISYARRVAQKYNTDHDEFILSYGDIPKTLEDLSQHIGEPFADPSALPLHHLSRMTREFVTVALNGDGGDEAFAGYQRYWLDPLANIYCHFPGYITQQLVPRIASFFPDRTDSPVGKNIINGIKRLRTISKIDPRASILRWGSYFSPEMKRSLWQEPIPDSTEAFLVDRFETALATGYLDRTLSTDIHTYLPGDLLVKADRMTMMSSLEGRSPFLDHELASWAARLPENVKIKGWNGKYLLRKAFIKDLPPQIINRGKQGFSIPIGNWFQGPLSGWVNETLLLEDNPCHNWFSKQQINMLLTEHRNMKQNHGKRIYALVMLFLWARSQ